jgi:hypothetical protein
MGVTGDKGLGKIGVWFEKGIPQKLGVFLCIALQRTNKPCGIGTIWRLERNKVQAGVFILYVSVVLVSL